MSYSELAATLAGMEAIDLSHTLEEDMPVYPAHSRYHHPLWDSFATGAGCMVYQLVINEHCGTHVDAISHFMRPEHAGWQDMAGTPVTQFTGRALTLDFSHYKDTDVVTAEEIVTWERERRLSIMPGDIVLFRFGWDRYWAPRSEDRTYTASWPGISGEAAAYVRDRGGKAVGCDTLAIDSSYAADSPAHYELLGGGVNILENLTRLDRVLGESLFVALPLKIKDGSGSPVRAIAYKRQGE
ncbi:cyclase family protein [Cohnella sp. 56]|uniref:cyclase family protein n=1 Tax=Cohnella sp. 56 TaxID=3113722 RepID=UPI0030E77D7D